MALSGTINGSTSNQYIDSKIEWLATQSILGNYSVVTATLYYRRNNTGFTTEGTGNFTLTINGTSQTEYSKHLVIRTDWVPAATASVTVPHNSDGTKSFSISAAGSLPGTSLSGTYCSGTPTLNTIPRQSQFSYITSSLILTGSTSIAWTITRYSAAYTHVIMLSMGSYSKRLSVSATTGSATIPMEWLRAMPNSRVGTITVTLTTYNGSTQIGNPVTVYVNAYVPESVKPSLVSFRIQKATGCKEPGEWAKYIQGCSKAELFLSVSLDNTYGSQIKKLTIAGSGVSHTVNGTTSTSAISDYISESGIVTYRATAEDTRGSTGAWIISINVDSYAPPMPENCVAFRCLEDGTANDAGTYMGVKSGCKFSPCSGHNSASLKAYWRKAGAAAWQPAGGTSLPANTFTVLGPQISLFDAYEILITATDAINTTPSAVSQMIVYVRTTQICFMLKRGGNGVSFGRIATDENCLDARDWQGRFSELVVGGNPVADSVIEQGIKGIWTYRKWASGIAECWGEKYFTCNLSGVGASVYVANGSADFPFAFAARPIVSGSCPNTYANWVNIASHISNYGKCEWLYYQTNDNGTGEQRIVYIYAVGRWK